MRLEKPAELEANGLWNPFSRKKKYRITCGFCYHIYDEKVPVSEGHFASSICPNCHTQNIWSHEKFIEYHKIMTEES